MFFLKDPFWNYSHVMCPEIFFWTGNTKLSKSNVLSPDEGVKVRKVKEDSCEMLKKITKLENNIRWPRKKQSKRDTVA